MLSTEYEAEVDNTIRDLQNSSYPMKAEFNNCFIIYSKYFLLLKGVSPIRSLFSFHQIYNTTLSPGFLGQRFNNLQRAALLTAFVWRHRFNNFRRAALLTSLIQYGEDSFQIWWTVAGYGELCMWFNQSETGKYFEWIIMAHIAWWLSQWKPLNYVTQ